MVESARVFFCRNKGGREHGTYCKPQPNDTASPQTLVNKHAVGATPPSCFIPNARAHPRCPLALRSWNADAPNRKFQKENRDPLRNNFRRGAPRLDSRRPGSQKFKFSQRFLCPTNCRATLVNGREKQYLGKFPYRKNIQ